MAFARKLVSMNECLRRSNRGQPQLPNPVPDALETFRSMSWGDESELWQYAKLSEHQRRQAPSHPGRAFDPQNSLN